MPVESQLHRLAEDLTPRSGAEERIKRRLQERISRAPEAMRQAREALNPSPGTQTTIWGAILARITAPEAEHLFQNIREILTPDPLAIRGLLQRFSLNLAPVPVPSASERVFQRAKWVAAFALFILVVQLSPRLILSPGTQAESQRVLTPTRGATYLLAGELWQPVTDELTLQAGMRIQTKDGEASLLLGDDGVVRMAPNTELALLDLSRRLEPASELVPTIRLDHGKLWVQGLLPEPVRGITVSTPRGLVTVHGGSVSVALGETAMIEVYDRRADVASGGEQVPLVAGERTQLKPGGILVVKRVPAEQYDDAWVEKNLARDAVHRREIAQIQHERLASRAGILPTSTFYPIKRAAEAMDVLLTFDEEAKLLKRIQYADARLTEAAALIAEGENEAVSLPLEEYRTTLMALATGSGDSTLAQFLLSQAVVETTAEVSAALPGDEGYVLKKVILETSRALAQDGLGTEGGVQGGLLLDTLAVLTQTVQSGNLQGLNDAWGELQPQLTMLDDASSSLDGSVRKEIVAALGALSKAIPEANSSGGTVIDPDVASALAAYLPPEEPQSRSLSEADVLAIAQGIKDRIFLFDLQRSRINQFTHELRLIEDLDDRGRVLRRLYFLLPDGPEQFPQKVKQEMLKLQWEKANNNS